MFSLQDAEHLQPRHRRRLRRLPGPRQGASPPTSSSRRSTRSAPSTRSTGRASSRRSSTTSPATSRRRAATPSRSSFAVPSGNFGNICAGHVARSMGLPIRRLVARDQRERRARRVLPHRRLPRPRAAAETHETSSPSMDISKASNFERFVFDAARPRRGALARAVRRGRRRGATSTSRADELASGSRAFGFVSGTQHARRSARDDPRRARALRRGHRSAHRRRAQGRPRARRPGGADDRARDRARRPSSTPPSARRSVATHRGRRASPGSRTCRGASRHWPTIAGP